MELADFRLIGRGPSSTVYAADERGTGRRLAIKLLHDWDPTPLAWVDFERESDRVSRLAARTGVLGIGRVGRGPDRTPYVVMPFMEARSLAALVKRRGPLSGGEIVGIGEAVTSALIAAHGDGLTHGAVTPTNLLLSSGGAVLLADFGASVFAAPSRPASAHAAPEHLDGGRSEPGDVYALASSLYELAQGHAPFRPKGSRAAAALAAKRSGSVPAAPDLLTEHEIRDVLMAALHPDPAHRPTVGELQSSFGDCDMSPWFGAARPVPVVRLGPVVADPWTAPPTPAATSLDAPALRAVPPLADSGDGGTTMPHTAPAPMPADDADAAERRQRRFVLWVAAAAAVIAVLVGVNAVAGEDDATGTAGDRSPATAPPLATALAATTLTSQLDAPTTPVPSTATSSSVSSPAVATASTATSVAPTTSAARATTTITARSTPSTAATPIDEATSTTVRLAGPPTLPPPTTTPPPAPPPTVTTPASIVEPVPVTTLPPATAASTIATTVASRPTVGTLSVSPSASGVRAVANNGDRCASSRWVLSGPVSKEQSSSVPAGCFSSAHAFDSSWYQLSLTPGSYTISLTLTNGSGSSTASSAFTIG